MRPETLDRKQSWQYSSDGHSSGFLLWEGRNLVSSVKGHTGAVYASFVAGKEDEKGLVTACSGGKIKYGTAN